jgi:hypothetical protein
MSQISLTLQSIPKPNLKPISKVILIAEGLDLLTTFAGLLFFPQLWESNPMLVSFGSWLPTVLAKIAATIIIVIVIERVEKWPRLVWIVPTIAVLPVFWNIVCMLAEIVVRV